MEPVTTVPSEHFVGGVTPLGGPRRTRRVRDDGREDYSERNPLFDGGRSLDPYVVLFRGAFRTTEGSGGTTGRRPMKRSTVGSTTGSTTRGKFVPSTGGPYSTSSSSFTSLSSTTDEPPTTPWTHVRTGKGPGREGPEVWGSPVSSSPAGSETRTGSARTGCGTGAPTGTDLAEGSDGLGVGKRWRSR